MGIFHFNVGEFTVDEDFIRLNVGFSSSFCKKHFFPKI